MGDGEYPAEICGLIGTKLIFIVEKLADHGSKYDHSYKVKSICADETLVEAFNDNENVQTANNVQSSDVEGSNLTPENSDTITQLGPNVISLDDILPGDGSAVYSSVGSGSGLEASSSKPSKKMRLRGTKVEKL
ncbi:uncharacterized protein LOC130749351 [Lotus japonicus]|uniref:uncharacterized protein LOC130749351 n=1 Tax=Lotus japonicus TaxID=34305 RepID=UPI0025866225|nr:uncharacterized protein LOC130749351 [Lotus japonicus]